VALKNSGIKNAVFFRLTKIALKMLQLVHFKKVMKKNGIGKPSVSTCIAVCSNNLANNFVG
jgi:hypothetical protein